MLEQILDSKEVKKHVLFTFLLGFFYVIVGYAVSAYFFQYNASVAMLFAATLLLVPSMTHILNIEEKIESKEGMKNFLYNHRDIFQIYISLFLGIFFAFVMIGCYSQLAVFGYQLNFLEARGDLATDVISEFAASDYVPSFGNVLGLITQNLMVVVIAFVLSLFYGAGALFLIVLNASVFAAFICYLMKHVSNDASLLGVFLIHLVPELSGFLVAAIAGGVVSRAVVREKFGSQGFRNVMRDAFVLLSIAVGLIVIAAFLEVYVSAGLVKGLL